jgi:tetratricopeptide (TPR) repeat protein
MPGNIQMTNSTEVDAQPKTAGEEYVDSSTNATTEITHDGLARMFGRPEVEDAETQKDTSEITEVEEPASDPETDSEPDEDEESSLTDEITDEVEQDTEPEETGDKTQEPAWFRKRIDKLTAQRKEQEERVAQLEKKLEEKEEQETPVNTVDQVLDLKRLEELEKQALMAEEQIDETLDQDPKYDEDGEAYWQLGNNKLSKKQLIDIRKNARQAYRAVPARKEFLKQKAVTDENVSKLPMFSDPKDPYYDLVQQTLKSPIYRELESKIPDAKASVYLMMRGKMAIDAEVEAAKKPKQKSAVPPKPPPSSTGRASTDVGTVAPQSTPSEKIIKRKQSLLKSGNVSSEDAVALFR